MKAYVKLLNSLPCVLMLFAAASASGQQYLEAQKVALEPVAQALEFKDRGDGILWSAKVDEPSALYLRLHFSGIASPANCDYQIVVRDRQERVIARYSNQIFGKETSFLTAPLFTPRVIVEVTGLHTEGLRFSLDYYLRERDPMGRVIAEGSIPNWRNPEALPKSVAIVAEPALESIAKLYTGTGHVCTGFLVKEKAILTNYHCLSTSPMFLEDNSANKSKCSDITVQFDFDSQLEPQKSVTAQCLSVLAYDEKADYALLEVNADEIARGAVKRKALKLRAPNSPTEEVMVIHHPAGLATKISFGCLAYSNRTPNLLEHDCSTVGGSSGAPILSYDGSVVGLHYGSGVPESMTFGELRKALEDGKVFLNKAMPSDEVQRYLAGHLP